MENKIPQHVELPNVTIKIKKLRPSEILTYVTLKRYMNKDTKECYPSLDTISRVSGLSKPTIITSIKSLIDNELIEKYKKGKNNYYKFLEANEDGFEMFSFNFLDNPNLTPQEKAAYCMQQCFMFKNKDTQTGDLYYSNEVLSAKLGVSRKWLDKQNKSLESKDIITITHDRDEITGMVNNIRHFQLSKLDQAFVCILKNHDERIKSNEDDIEQLKKQNEELLKRITALENAHTYISK